MISDLKTQVFREGQTRPWDHRNRIRLEKLCIHALWKASATPWASITSHFTLFIELWNAGRLEKTQVFREGQTSPWDYEIRILREKSCRHVLWEVSTTPWASITSHFTLFIELWNAGRPEHRLVQILTGSLPDLTLRVNWLWLRTWFVIPLLI